MTALRIQDRLLMLMLVTLTGCGTAATDPVHHPAGTLSDSTPFMAPGIEQPPAVSADEATVPDDVEVIGTTADGQSRAYLISAMSGMTTHIANDLLGDVPVSVTYCDRTDFARAFTSAENSRPIGLGLQGWVDGEMSLLVNNQGYRHSGTDIPLEDHPVQRMTWGEWKHKHPDTTLVVTLLPAADNSVQPAPAEPEPGPSPAPP